MSLKVRNGYKFKNTHSLNELQNLYLELKNKGFYQNVQNIWDRYFLMLFINKYDRKKFNNPNAKIDKIDVNLEVIKQLRDSIKAVNNYESVAINIMTSMSFFIFEEKIYCRLSSDIPEIKNYLINHFNLEPYYYFNNSDIPEEFSKIEWEERERVWENFTPVFRFEIINYWNENIVFYPVLKNEMLEKHKDLLDKYLRSKLIFDNYKEKLIIKKLSLVEKSEDITDELILKVRKQINNKEFETEINLIKQEIYNSLDNFI